MIRKTTSLVRVLATFPFRYDVIFIRILLLYYESRKRELKTRPIYECPCDERLKTKPEKSTRHIYILLMILLHPTLLFICSILLVVYHESIKRELKIRCIYECRCNERLQTKTQKFTRLTYTGLVVELEHLKIETRLIDEKFVNTMDEYVT
jgi:hypothetical protein